MLFFVSNLYQVCFNGILNVVVSLNSNNIFLNFEFEIKYYRFFNLEFVLDWEEVKVIFKWGWELYWILFVVLFLGFVVYFIVKFVVVLEWW